MKAVVFAGGNQTRFGIPYAVQPKVLFSLGDGQTILSNIFKQIKESGVAGITLCAYGKPEVVHYAKEWASSANFHISYSTENLSNLGEYIFKLAKQEPVVFIFGDMYFPNGRLVGFLRQAKASVSKFDGIIAVTEEVVGDYKIAVQGDAVISIAKGVESAYYSCGLYGLFNHGLLSKAEALPKTAEVFGSLVPKGKFTYYNMGTGLVDLDTMEAVQLLPK